MNPYSEFVSGVVRAFAAGRTLPLGGLPPAAGSPPAPGAPCALIFSPHPDDEVIIGGWALRLRREAGWRIVNVAVTQGSNRARQAERWTELKGCCDHIGFELQATAPGGLGGIQVRTRQEDPAGWRQRVEVIAAILQREQPQVIFFPHDDDWNSTHIGTHHLVMDALGTLDSSFACFTAETEFWGDMRSPNIMLESSSADLSDLLAALSFHVGEVRRNPYHLRMPAWLMDNVRRGGELVGGQGGAPPDFQFATLYRLRRWSGGRMEPCFTGGRFIAVGDDPTVHFVEPNGTARQA